MNEAARYARRYHWLSEQMPSFVSEPHAAVACDNRGPTLNLVAGEGDKHRRAVTDLSREHPDRILRELRPLLQERELPLFAGLETVGCVAGPKPDQEAFRGPATNPTFFRPGTVWDYAT